MLPLPYALARPFLFGLDPEAAHDLTLGALERIQHTPLRCLVAQPRVADPVEVAGLRFPNRVGLAAGLDKNGRCIDGLAAMGFGDPIDVGLGKLGGAEALLAAPWVVRCPGTTRQKQQ